jgi:hypothetical protein
MRAFACLILLIPSMAMRVNVNRRVAAAVTLKDLEDTWLSISKSRTGSWFTGDDAVLVVEDGKVLIDGEEEEDGFYDKTNVFGHLSMKKDRIQLQSNNFNEIWALTGSETEDSDCSAWKEYLKFMDKLKESRKNPPPGMFSLAQANQTEKPQESREIVCVDWTWAGDVRPPPEGMYSLAEVSGERTMHWLKKPPPSEDEIAAMVEEAMFELTAMLLPLGPLSSKKGIESKLAWAQEAMIALLSTPLQDAKALILTFMNDAEYELGMSNKLKAALVQDILNALAPLKEVVEIRPKSVREV